MTEYAVVQLLAWAAVGAVIFLFAATGGFDLGAGMLLPFIAKTDDERRVVINTVGPTWDGNQVWLIIIGAGMFAIWPRAYAAVFSGFYFAMLLVLWALFFRPVAFEYRSKMTSLRWRHFWDWALFFGSFVPTLLFGVALGNVLLGVPFNYDPFSLRFDYMGEFITLLRPFALLCGLVSVFLFVMHGSAYIQLRTMGVVSERAKRAFSLGALGFVVTFLLAGFCLSHIPGYTLVSLPVDPISHPLDNGVLVGAGAWFQHYKAYPLLFLLPVLSVVFTGLAVFWMRRGRVILTFCGSLLNILCVLGTYGMTLFPFVLPSSNYPDQSLLIWNVSSSMTSLIGILIVALVTLPLIFVYTTFVYRKMWGRQYRLSVSEVTKRTHELY